MFRKGVLPICLLLALILAACRPIVAPQGAGDSATPALENAPDAGGQDLADRYEGTLSVAGMELAIIVKLVAGADGYTGTIDIPDQAAMGIPLHDILVQLPTIHFEMLGGPSRAVFDGELGEGGAVSGTFLQSGVEGTFTLTPVVQVAESAAEPAPTAGMGETYTDPAGRYSVPVPTNWTLTEGDGYVLLMDPEESIKMYVVVLPGDDLAQLTADAWKLVDPAFDVTVDDTVEPPAGPNLDGILVTNYDSGDDNRILQAVAQGKDGDAYIILVDGGLAGLQKRNAQVTIIGSGLKILAVEETDLSGVEPLPITDEITAQLEEFIARYMDAFKVPGAAVGIVQDGELVYAKGFGVADPQTGLPMEPDTNVMIGSTGKSLTTMMMGTLVDDGLMTWDTPAIELYPEFRVKDPALSETITMRNLVCACTGVPRRDLEFVFNAADLSAEDTVRSLGEFEFFTDFGEAFQYSNQMVATAGYIAGDVSEGGRADLETEYAQALHARVLDPIGMENTTVSFDDVIARDKYAIPHALTLAYTYEPIALDAESVLVPVAPAGLHWSTLEDMAKYMITELNEGVAPDGTRVISAENLKETWKPQIALSNDASYGLGWIVSEYMGQPVISHAGNTIGFTSGFTFLPEKDLGLIVLTNGRATNLFSDGVAGRLLELVYQQPPETEVNLDFYLERIDEQIQELLVKIQDKVDVDAVTPYLGRYMNPALGNVDLSLVDGKLLLDAGEFVGELKPLLDDDGNLDGYIQMDAPLQGIVFKLEQNDGGMNVIKFGEGAVEYTFDQVEPAGS